MPIEHRDEVGVVAHALARDELTRLRDAGTEQVAFRSGLVRLGRLCGSELVDAYFETEQVDIETPLTRTEGERVAGLEDVVVVTVLRAATPFVEGLLSAIPSARQGVISASRDEAAGMGPEGTFPISVDYVKLPTIEPDDRVIVADPMLATGSTMAAVLEEVVAAGATPARTIALSVVAAPPGLDRVATAYPDVERVTVAVDDELDEHGFIVPGLGDAGDRAFGTT